MIVLNKLYWFEFENQDGGYWLSIRDAAGKRVNSFPGSVVKKGKFKGKMVFRIIVSLDPFCVGGRVAVPYILKDNIPNGATLQKSDWTFYFKMERTSTIINGVEESRCRMYSQKLSGGPNDRYLR